MKCDKCLCNETYTKDYEHLYNIRDKEITFTAKRRFCRNCDSLVYDAELDNKASSLAIEKYNKEYGITKEDILKLRKDYNLSQELFSKVIGCAKKTLISYEKGTAIPNDNYVIIINSLLSKPDTIETLIDANKQHFTEEEFKKIKSKIIKFVADNTVLFDKQDDFKPTEYNGYTKLNFDKVVNMILYFAEKGVLKTKLLKEMFYADFLYFKEYGMSITGLKYAKINYGPVPDQQDKILSKCIANKCIREDILYDNDYEYHNIVGIKKYDKNLFDKDELDVLKKVKDFFKNFKSKEIADFSHEEQAFIDTEFAKIISYDYAFDINRIV